MAMAPPPVEQNGDAASGAESQRSAPTPFLTKTYQLVDDRSIDDIISWNDDGSTFVVWNPTVFARDLLPKYFKHNNFSSFVRQLNTYGFRKVMPDRWEFSNDCFRRGEKRLLCEIQRRKVVPLPATAVGATVIQDATVVVPTAIPMISPSNSGEEQVMSSQSSPSVCGQNCAMEVMDENERLRKENVLLCKELTQMKSLCNNILTLMSNYANGRSEGVMDCARALDLLPMCRSATGGRNASVVIEDGEEAEEVEEEEEDTRLFLGLKRGRCEDLVECNAALQLQQPGRGKVKSEPLDRQNG